MQNITVKFKEYTELNIKQIACWPDTLMQTQEFIKEKLKSVETEIKSMLSSYDNLSILDHGIYILVLLQKFSKVFFFLNKLSFRNCKKEKCKKTA